MASDSLATLTNISNGMFAGGAVAFGVAALVLGFVRRTKRHIKRHEIEGTDKKKRPWQQEIGDEFKNVWATGRRREKKKETYVNPIDVWVPSDIERGLERIPGPPSIMEMDEVDPVQENEVGEVVGEVEVEMVPEEEVVVKTESREALDGMDISPISSVGERFLCTYPGCTKSFVKQYDLNHHTRYHDKTKSCPTCPKSFATIKDLNRHINSKHAPDNAKKTFHCTVVGCKFAKLSIPRQRFARKDNWRRHMRDKHGKRDDYLAAMEADAMDVDVDADADADEL